MRRFVRCRGSCVFIVSLEPSGWLAFRSLPEGAFNAISHCICLEFGSPLLCWTFRRPLRLPTFDAVRCDAFNCVLFSQFGLKFSPIAGKLRQVHGSHLRGMFACARSVMRKSDVVNAKVDDSLEAARADRWVRTFGDGSLRQSQQGRLAGWSPTSPPQNSARSRHQDERITKATTSSQAHRFSSLSALKPNTVTTFVPWEEEGMIMRRLLRRSKRALLRLRR